MLKMIVKLQNMFRSNKGQGMVEYGLIIGLVAVVLIAVLIAMRGSLGEIFNRITGELGTAATASAS